MSGGDSKGELERTFKELKAIKILIRLPVTNSQMLQAHELLDDLIPRLELILKAHPTPKEEWISVKERPPETNVTVQAWRPGKYPAGEYAHATYQPDVYQKWSAWLLDKTSEWFEGVTHWMPLPSPPTKDQTEKENE